ncbi:MAG TPA: MFS transporter [Trebonia sp.]|jgi:predicted MFS family arabinose efflux permease
MVLLFAIATGLSAANLYYAQPILGTIASDFHSGSGTAGLIVTLSQAGYAVGLALLVPLGDLVVRRRLVPAVLAITTVGLILSAIAPSVMMLIGVALLVGVGSVAAQILVPMAASMAKAGEQGRVVGTVMSGLLLGILLARTVSGIVAGVSSWRVVYIAAAVLAAILAVVLSRVLPDETPQTSVSYGTLLTTTAKLLLTERTLAFRSLLGALGFAAFSVFWTTMAFLLSGAPYHYSDLVIGLFGLVGAGGALCANFAGRWADRGLTTITTVVFAVCTIGSFALLWFGRDNLILLIVGIIVLDIGVQGIQVTNQSVVYKLAEARSRVNAGYMVTYFIGGALGSALGGALYDSHGWAGVCVLGAAIGAAITVFALLSAARRGPAAPARADVTRTAGALEELPEDPIVVTEG